MLVFRKKNRIMKRIFTFKKLCLLLCFITLSNLLKAANFSCALNGSASGNWNSSNTWILTSGTDADGIPDADDNVTISQGRVIVNVTSEVNNVNVLADNNIRLTVVQTLRIFGRIDAIVGSTSGASPIQGNGSAAGVIEFPASTSRDVTTAFYRNDYTFTNRPVDVNFGLVNENIITNTISIFGFQSATVQVRNCNVILKDNYYIGYGSTPYNVTIENTATVSQNFNAGKTFGFRSATSTDGGINNFIIRGTFTTGFDVIAANAISVAVGGKFVVSDAARATGLSNATYEFNGTLEYDRTIAYTAGGEFGTFSIPNIVSLRIKGNITLPDLPASRTYTITGDITFNGGKLNLFEHELNITGSTSTTINGAGIDNYIIAQTNGARVPRITADLNISRTGIIIPVGTNTLFTPVFVTATNTSTLPATITANMYADGAATSSCGITTPSSAQLVNVAYSVTATPATQALDVQFHYPQTVATSVRGSAYVPTTAKVVGCNGSSIVRYSGALGENSNNTLNTFFATGSFGGANPNLTSFNIITSEPSLTANVPTISNVGAGSITENSFIVGYTINANGSNTTPIVRYGTAANNLNQSVTGTVISGTTNTNSQVSITGLTGGTQYFYRVEASNAIGSATPSITNNVTTVAPAPPVVPAPSNGLLAYYGFNNNINSHNGNYNLTSATTPSYVTGKVGNGVSFSNTADRTLFNTTLANALPSNGPFTICFWQNTSLVAGSTIYPTYFEMFGSAYVRTQSTNYSLLSTGYAYSNSVVTTPTFEGRDYGNYNPNASTGWNHFAFVHNPGLNTNSNTLNFAFYLNGTYIGFVLVGTNHFIHKFNNMFTIGGGTNAAGVTQANKRFDGIIDEFYVYNRVLTPTEIAAVRDEQNGQLLPVKLTSFTATLQNGVTQLNWATSEEINASHFEIEYSNNGKDFTSVEVVNAIGASGVSQSYQAFHKVNATPNHYYRLKMVDKDGKYAYSAIVAVNSNAANALNIVLQNTVVKNQLQFAVTSNRATTVNIAVTNSVGQTILQPNKKPISAGSNSFSYIINNLSSGVYFLEMVDDSGAKQVVKFLK